MHATLRPIALLFAALLAACASGPPTPVVDYKPGYDFGAVKTIGYYHDSGQVVGDNPLRLSDMQRERIDDALAYALRNSGYRIIDDAGAADLLLSWHLVTEEKTDVQTWQTPTYGGYYGYNRYSAYNCWSCMGGTEVTVRNYTQGTFIVDLIDPALKKSVWRSVIQSRLKGEPSRDQAWYNETATAIFASFPPGATP